MLGTLSWCRFNVFTKSCKVWRLVSNVRYWICLVFKDQVQLHCSNFWEPFNQSIASRVVELLTLSWSTHCCFISGFQDDAASYFGVIRSTVRRWDSFLLPSLGFRLSWHSDLMLYSVSDLHLMLRPGGNSSNTGICVARFIICPTCPTSKRLSDNWIARFMFVTIFWRLRCSLCVIGGISVNW